MKRMINNRYIALILGLSAVIISCTNDDITDGSNNKDNRNTDGTVFVGGKIDTSDNAKSRTAFDYLPSIGANSKFVWTVGDKIYLADGSVSEPLTGAYEEKLDIADFIFRGKNFTAPSYDIYYPGKNAIAYNKLNIPTADNGGTYYDYTNSGKFYSYPWGDCGFAKAVKKPDGKYYFELEHLCAFLFLTPYVQTDNLGKIIHVKKIRITADSNITGEYTITPTGLTGTGSSKTMETTVQSDISGDIHFQNHIIHVDGSQKYRDYTSWLFHFAPTNTKLKIEYQIGYRAFKCDGSSFRWGEEYDSTVVKNIPLYSYEKNTVTPITSSITFPMYKAIFSRWDAVKDYSLYADSVNPANPRVLTDKFKNNADYKENKTALIATKTAKDCPNKIEAAWYAMHGDPYYDENYAWTNGTYICKGGIWIKKKSEIPGFNSTNLPPDVTWGNDGCANTSIKKGRPSDTSKYFFLPALGQISLWSNDALYLLFATYGYYWTKDAKDSDFAWTLFFHKDAIRVQRWYRNGANALWTIQ